MVVPRFVDAALNEDPLTVYDDGSQVRCFAHVLEVVDAVVNLMETPAAAGRVFNIGSDEPVTVRELAEAVIARTGSRSEIRHIPYSEAYGHDFEDIQRRVPDVTRLKETLGTAPTMSLSAILDDVIRWKRGEPGDS
jgi:UDP-glucose 4-epimerase